MSLRDSLKTAAAVPGVDFFAQLVGQLVMIRAQIIPEHHWDEVAKWLNEIMGDEGLDNKDTSPFQHHKNHRRSEDHNMWQKGVFCELVDDKDWGHNVWVIPVDELLCLHYDDANACDFVGLDRLSFIGTEKELEAALEKLTGSKR